MADNKVIFGLSNVHIAFKEDEGWGTPVKVPGAVSLQVDPEGSENKFYADNIVYYVVSSNAGYSGSIEMADIPFATLAQMLGWEIDGNGALVEVTDGVPNEFALLFEVDGDAKKRRSVFYNTTAARPSVSNSTKTDSSDPTTQTLNVTMTGIDIEGKNVAKAVMEPSETNKALFESWYESVYTPDKAAA